MSKTESNFSIIMTVYDQATTLEQNLPAYLRQDYAQGYRVIVVNESSTDDTDDVLKLLKQDNPHLYTTFLPKPNRNDIRRRLALTLGVKASDTEWIIFTTIDYVPTADDWLQKIAEQTADTDTEVILGYSNKKYLRLQTYDDLSKATNLIRKTERKNANGRKANRMKFSRGQYDFIAVRRSQGHEVLKLFDERVGRAALFLLRMRIWLSSIFEKGQTIKIENA